MAVTRYRNVIRMDADGDEYPGELIVQAIHYTNTVGDDFAEVVKELKLVGKVYVAGPVLAVFTSPGAGGNDFINFDEPLHLDGITWLTLGNGKITVYLV